MNDVVIASAARTAIGSYGKSRSGVPPSELGAIATVAAFLIHYGLGAPIFDALGQPDIFRTELVAAGGLTILLALTADALLTLLQRALTPWTRLR